MSDLKSWHNNLPSIDDELLEARTIMHERLHSTPNPMTGCTSYLQRKLKCSYSHAAALMDLMVERHWITAVDDRGARTVL